MTKPKAKAPPAAKAAPAKVAAKAAPAKAAAVDKHAGHTAIDSASWDEAAGHAVPFRLCSCGAKRALGG